MVVQVLINDLIAVSNTQNAILYADDTKIYLTGYIFIIRIKPQYEKEQLSIWLKANEPRFNVSKTKSMVLSKQPNYVNCTLKVNEEKINVVNYREKLYEV